MTRPRQLRRRNWSHDQTMGPRSLQTTGLGTGRSAAGQRDQRRTGRETLDNRATRGEARNLPAGPDGSHGRRVVEHSALRRGNPGRTRSPRGCSWRMARFGAHRRSGHQAQRRKHHHVGGEAGGGRRRSGTPDIRQPRPEPAAHGWNRRRRSRAVVLGG